MFPYLSNISTEHCHDLFVDALLFFRRKIFEILLHFAGKRRHHLCFCKKNYNFWTNLMEKHRMHNLHNLHNLLGFPLHWIHLACLPSRREMFCLKRMVKICCILFYLPCVLRACISKGRTTKSISELLIQSFCESGDHWKGCSFSYTALVVCLFSCLGQLRLTSVQIEAALWGSEIRVFPKR